MRRLRTLVPFVLSIGLSLVTAGIALADGGGTMYPR
jgi:hypothetical protein